MIYSAIIGFIGFLGFYRCIGVTIFKTFYHSHYTLTPPPHLGNHMKPMNDMKVEEL